QDPGDIGCGRATTQRNRLPTRRDQPYGLPRDLQLRFSSQRVLQRNGQLLAVLEELRATVGACEQSLTLKECKVPPHRRLRDTECARQVRKARRPATLEQREHPDHAFGSASPA